MYYEIPIDMVTSIVKIAYVVFIRGVVVSTGGVEGGWLD